MASRSQRQQGDPDLETVLDDLEHRLERLKKLYEQYFMGIQKIPPAQLHKEIERGIRELTQRQPRRTALRYRLTTIAQRFGSYNTYWNRVLRQIEQGTYTRDIARVKRRAYARDEEIPDEVLAKMPPLMRKRVLKDRERIARRHGGADGAAGSRDSSPPAQHAEGSGPRVHHIDESDPLLGADLDTDMEDLFDSIMAEDAPVGNYPAPAARAPTSAEIGRSGPKVADAAAGGDGEAAAWREPGVPGDGPRVGPTGGGQGSARRTAAPASGGDSADGWREPGRRGEGGGAGRRSGEPAAPQRGGDGRPASRRDRLPPGMDEDKARDLYQRYVRARKMVGAGEDVTFDQLMGKLRSQAPRIMKQHQADGVDFNVVLKDNRVVVKASPKK